MALKNEIYRYDEAGNIVIKNGKNIIQGYERFIPDTMNVEVLLAIIWMLIGVILIWIIEKTVNKN